MTVTYHDPFGARWRCGTLQLLLTWKGSLLQIFWLELLGATCIVLVVTLIWMSTFENTEDISKLLDRTEVVFVALGQIVTRFQAALGMMLGFYTTIIYNRWWHVRNVANDAVSAIKGAVIYVNSYLLGQEPDDASSSSNKEQQLTPAELSFTLARWLNLSHAIAIGEFYVLQPNEFAPLETLLMKGLMTDHELCFIQQSRAPDKYDVPLRWYIDLLDKAIRSDNFSLSLPPCLAMVNNQVTRFREALDTLRVYRTTPVPLCYRQLVELTVYFYMIILIAEGGLGALRRMYDDETSTPFLKTMLFVTVPFMFEYFLFVGWLMLADALADPFRHWSDELEWENYVRHAYVASMALLENEMGSASRQGPLSSAHLKKATQELHETKEATFKAWSNGREVNEDFEYIGQVRGWSA